MPPGAAALPTQPRASPGIAIACWRVEANEDNAHSECLCLATDRHDSSGIARPRGCHRIVRRTNYRKEALAARERRGSARSIRQGGDRVRGAVLVVGFVQPDLDRAEDGVGDAGVADVDDGLQRVGFAAQEFALAGGECGGGWRDGGTVQQPGRDRVAVFRRESVPTRASLSRPRRRGIVWSMSDVAVDVRRVARLSATQVHAMLVAGILPNAGALELIDGLLVWKDRTAHGGGVMTIGEKHNLVIKLLARLDPDLALQGSHMQTQGPVRLSGTDEPEPDGAIVRGDPRDYADQTPTSADVTCVLEVADSSLEYDRTTKATLYGRAGIPQYVIVNLRHLCLEVFADPADGAYRRSSVVRAGDLVALVTATGDVSIPAERLLP